MKLRFNVIALVTSIAFLASYARSPAAQTLDNAFPRVYVFGEVISPGVYVIRPPVTMRRAVSIAGGLTNEALPANTFIIRKPSGGGKLQWKRVDLSAVMKGEAEDVPLEDDDVIVVNRDRTAKLRNER